MRWRVRSKRWRQHLAYGFGIGLGGLALLGLVLPFGERLHAKGPMNSGHGELACISCHLKAPGSVRQQLQANMRFLLGQRQASADFGHREVDNAACLSCHERPNDRHPVYRFLEPRFAKVRQTLGPHLCTSCHQEHTGQRVTLVRIDYCAECHKDTRLRKDPLDVPHDRLIALKLWETCLGCHDFHGNHIFKTATVVEQIVPSETIRAYFAGGPSPYGEARRYRAKEVLHD